MTEKKVKGSLGDMNFVRSAVEAQILKTLEEDKFPIDKSMMNLKLFLGFTAIAFALVAQFYPRPWPETWVLTAVCVAGYSTFSSTMQWMLWFHDMDAAAMTKPQGKSKYGLLFRTDYKRFGEDMTVIMTTRDPKNRLADAHTVRATESIAKWFDAEGTFYPDQFNIFFRNQVLKKKID
eukprot:c3765_g1_i1.p1 GENE.c3765_g1_i1~~c3765_g1_i1.p1  ORF type:complete len:190 (+),score=16.14 c3765_g1_i1:39-572(+)